MPKRDFQLTQAEIQQIAQAQLAIDYNCRPCQLEQEGITFTQARCNPGCRPFPRSPRFFELITMGQGVVATAEPQILPLLKRDLAGKSRDEIFAMPFALPQGLYYLPRLSVLSGRPAPALPAGFRLAWAEGEEIHRLYRLEGFHNAIQYDLHHPRPDVLAALALTGEGENTTVAAIAGSSADSALLWQIGIDVLPSYQRLGLAAALVEQLAREILRRGQVPYYGTSPSNLPSQRTAIRAGFQPAWTCTYRTSYPQGAGQ